MQTFRLKKRVHLESRNSIFSSIFLNCFFAEILCLLRKSVPHYEKILLVFRTATLPCVSSSKTTTIYLSLLFDINLSARLRKQKKQKLISAPYFHKINYNPLQVPIFDLGIFQWLFFKQLWTVWCLMNSVIKFVFVTCSEQCSPFPCLFSNLLYLN